MGLGISACLKKPSGNSNIVICGNYFDKHLFSMLGIENISSCFLCPYIYMYI